jgi:hypothetical protein
MRFCDCHVTVTFFFGPGVSLAEGGLVAFSVSHPVVDRRRVVVIADHESDLLESQQKSPWLAVPFCSVFDIVSCPTVKTPVRRFVADGTE